jgi:hypothetical protein
VRGYYLVDIEKHPLTTSPIVVGGWTFLKLRTGYNLLLDNLGQVHLYIRRIVFKECNFFEIYKV